MRPKKWVLWLLFASARSAHAQTTNATCTSNSTTSWLFNSAGHSPCLAWSRLQSLCLDPTSYIIVPPLLDPSWSYELPSAQTSCQCNVVAYSLMAGCAYCQTGESGSWAEEQQWQDACGGAYAPDGLGFVEDVQPIPAYAWRAWDGARWSPVEASRSASLYASSTPTGTTTLSRSMPTVPTPTGSYSTTSTAATASLNSTTNASLSPSPTSSSANNDSDTSPAEKWGPIVGGIAGGIVALVLLIFLIRHFSQKRKTKAGGERTEIVRYHDKPDGDQSDARSRATSFFTMFGGYASPRGGRARDYKRETEFITDPLSFADPRPAPKVPVVPQASRKRDMNDSLAYTATQQRLKARGTAYDSDDESDLVSAVMPGRTLIVSNAGPDSDSSLTSPDTPSRRGVLKNAAPAQAKVTEGARRPQAPPSAEPLTAGQDFSQPRPYSDAATLPSLYDPPTGAPTYRGTMHTAWTHDTRPSTVVSPTSHYPPTNRDSRASTIGAALGSGRAPMVGEERYWSRQKLPPVPGEGEGGAAGGNATGRR